MSQEEIKQRRRRTPEELRAHYEQKLKQVDENEKKEMARLLAGILDDLVKLTTFKESARYRSELDSLCKDANAILVQVFK